MEVGLIKLIKLRCIAVLMTPWLGSAVGFFIVGVTHIQMALIGDVNRKTFVLVATFCYPGG